MQIRRVLSRSESSGVQIWRLFGGRSFEELVAEAAAFVPGSGGLIVLPAQAIGASFGDAHMVAIGTGAVLPENRTGWAVRQTVHPAR